RGGGGGAAPFTSAVKTVPQVGHLTLLPNNSSGTRSLRPHELQLTISGIEASLFAGCLCCFPRPRSADEELGVGKRACLLNSYRCCRPCRAPTGTGSNQGPARPAGRSR